MGAYSKVDAYSNKYGACGEEGREGLGANIDAGFKK